MRECCVGLNVGDESASLLVFSVCADGSVVWYFGCPGCWVELRFLYCDDVRLCCELFVACVGVCRCGDVWRFVWWGNVGKVGTGRLYSV